MTKEGRRRREEKDDAEGMGDRTGRQDCPVVVAGIGVSSGRLKSLKQFLAGLSSGQGVAYVLIQHPDPLHKALTLRRLRGLAALDVVEATDGMSVLADRIHVMPPDRFLNITGCRLTLQEPVDCNGLRMPIDHFFCSLAADQRRRSCGIMLSGAGSDGTIGLSEIKAAGGRTLAEDPNSAEDPEMPRNAIEAAFVDEVLPAGAMAGAIAAVARRVAEETRNEPAESPEFDAGLRTILEMLRLKAGHDFRCYKPSTLVRRIRRRMTLGKISTFSDYTRFLEEHAEEVGFLQKDLLIGVTEFFRQPEAWEVLEEKVVAPLVRDCRPKAEIRVWVPGCSTGKEAYSLAMLLTEQVERSGKEIGIQIFATDSDPGALAIARRGTYPKEEIDETISAERLNRFFTPKDGSYQIIKGIRGQVVFAPQNLTADPPFSRMDLISCRNLLIYLDQQVQKKIIALFHFALKEGGHLFLGNAETIGDREDLFEPVSKKWRIYRRIGVGRPVGVEIPVRPTGETPMPGKPSAAATWSEPGRIPWGELSRSPAPRVSLTSAAQQILLDRFAPACVMIDRKLQVLYVHGAVENYLTFPAGELTTRVVDMAREGLRARLRGAISKSLEAGKPVSITARVRRGSIGAATGEEKSVLVKATVSPLRHPRDTDGLMLVTFEDTRVSAAKSGRKVKEGSGVRELEDELKAMREELQSTIEQMESSNDQLKASNEEVTATNEELQSANEEMETSKEELQSLNEELNTINIRLQEKVDELEVTNNDVVNLLSSTSIATVFLDKELKVRRYTPASTRLFSLIPTDVDRPIVDVLRRFSDETMVDEAHKVLADLMPLVREVQAEEGRWYIRRITPYRTQDDRIEGVVITFVDLTDRKQAEEAAREAHERAAWLARFPEENPSPVMRVSAEGRVLYRNPVAAKLSGWASEVGQPLPGLLLPLLERAMTQEKETQGEVELGGRSYSISVAPVVAEHYANVYGRDITEHRRAEEAIARAKEEWERTFDTVPDMIAILDDQHRIVRVNRAMADRLGVTPDQCVGLHCYETVHGMQEAPGFCPHALTCGDGREHVAEVHEPRLGGDFMVSTTPLCNAQGEIMGSVHVARDITERKRVEDALREINERFRVAITGSPITVHQHDTELRFIWVYNPLQGFTAEDFVGKKVEDVYSPEDAARLIKLKRQVLESGAGMRGETWFTLKGERRFVAFSMEPMRDGSGRITGITCATVDISGLKQAEKALSDSEARFKLLSETASRLLATSNPQEIVDALCRDVMTHLDCDAFFNFLVDEKAGRLHLNACAGIPEEEARKIEWLDFGAAVCGCAARDRMPIIAENIRNTPDPRTELIKTYGIQAYACHPLMIQGHLIGTLSFGTKKRPHFYLEELALMRTVTDQVATAMERVRLIRELEKSRDELEKRVQERTSELAQVNETLHQLSQRILTAQEEERKRVAGDIHDSLGSLLSQVKFMTEGVIQKYAGKGVDPGAAEPLRSVLLLVQESVNECRRLQMDLRPPMLDDLGILATLSWFCRRFEATYPGIHIEQETGIEEVQVPDSLRTSIFRVTQEALNNIVKHSKADLITLALRSDGNNIALTVRDNGVGFDPDEILSRTRSQRGLGLESMKERVELSGGAFGIESAEGKGTLIRASWPL